MIRFIPDLNFKDGGASGPGATVRLPRGVEVLMKDISLWGKEWYPWISQRWEAIFKCSDNERNSSPQKWRFSHRYLFQIWMTFFLLRKCSESCSCCSFSIAIVYGDYICQVPKRTKYSKIHLLYFKSFCLKKLNLFTFCVMNRPKSKSLFHSKYMRHFALKSNTVQVGCQWHWMSLVLMFPTAKLNWDQTKSHI